MERRATKAMHNAKPRGQSLLSQAQFSEAAGCACADCAALSEADAEVDCLWNSQAGTATLSATANAQPKANEARTLRIFASQKIRPADVDASAIADARKRKARRSVVYRLVRATGGGRREARFQRRDAVPAEIAAPQPDRIFAYAEILGDPWTGLARKRQ